MTRGGRARGTPPKRKESGVAGLDAGRKKETVAPRLLENEKDA